MPGHALLADKLGFVDADLRVHGCGLGLSGAVLSILGRIGDAHRAPSISDPIGGAKKQTRLDFLKLKK